MIKLNHRCKLWGVCTVTLALNLSGLFYAVGLNNYFAYPVIVSGFIAIAGTPKRSFQNVPKSLVFIALLMFAISLLFSCLYHLEIELFVTASGIFLSVFVANYLRSIFSIAILKLILQVSFLIHLFILLLCLISSDFALIGYIGFFRNSNSTGLYAATALVLLLSIDQLNRVKSQHGGSAALFFVLTALLLLLVVISSSRSALIASTFGLVTWFVTGKGTLGRRKLTIMATCIICAVVLIQSDLFYDAVLYKYYYYIDRDNVLNNRSDIWEIALSDIRLLGHGRLKTIEDGVGESIYFAILNQFGLLPLLLFLSVIVQSIFYPFYVRIRFGDNSLIVLLPVILLFVLQGVSASIFGYSIYFLWIISLAWMSSKRGMRQE